VLPRLRALLSTATKANPAIRRSPAPKAAYDEGRALGRAVRHQRRQRSRTRFEGDRRPAVVQGDPRRSRSASTPTMTTEQGGGQLSARGGCAPGAAPQNPGPRSNGLGERCGNANLVSIIPTLKAEGANSSEKFRHLAFPTRKLKGLGPCVGATPRRACSTRAPNRHAPYRRAESAFAHQGRHPRLRDHEGARAKPTSTSRPDHGWQPPAGS